MKLFRVVLIYVCKATLVVALVWGGMFVFEYGKTYVSYQQQPEYHEQPFELKLKSAPQDVLYSEAKETSDGKGEVEYAYLAGEVSPLLDEDMGRRTPNSQTKILAVKEEGGKKTETLLTTFFGRPELYKESQGKWRQIETATTSVEAFALSGAIPYIKRRELVEHFTLSSPLYAATATYYPDPNAETTSVDGVAETLNSGSFSASRNDTIAQTSWSGATSPIATFAAWLYIDYPIFQNFYLISRTFFLFDSSALPDGATVSAASISIFVTSKVNGDNDGNDTITVYSSSPASNTDIVAEDFDQVGSTALSNSLDITSISTSAYNTFTLNATGIGSVSKTGVSKFSLRIGNDISDVSPDVDTENTVNCYAAEQTGTSNDPKLDVTYTVNTFSFGQWFPF